MTDYKPIPDIDGYLISEVGDVLSLKTNSILKPFRNKSVKVYSGGKYHFVNGTHVAHRLWHGECPEGFVRIKFDGLDNYRINPYGEVFSVKHLKVRSQSSWRGWRKVGLWNHVDKRTSTYYVHKLVALSFDIDKPDGADQINHIDGNKENNHFSNLEWCTAKHNTNHAIEMGLRPRAPIDCKRERSS